MPTYDVTSRTTGPIVVNSVTADTKEMAIQQTIDATEEGSSVEVMNVVQTSVETATPSAKK